MKFRVSTCFLIGILAITNLIQIKLIIDLNRKSEGMYRDLLRHYKDHTNTNTTWFYRDVTEHKY